MTTVKGNDLNRRFADNKMKVVELRESDNFSELSKSEYDFKDVVNLQQFDQLSKQINMNAQKRQNLIDSLYGSRMWKDNGSFKRINSQKQVKIQSKYQQEYHQWKGTTDSENKFEQTYASTLALLNKSNQKSQMKRLMKQFDVESGTIYQYSTKNKALNKINGSYEAQLDEKMKMKQLQKQFGFQQYMKVEKQRNGESQKIKQINDLKQQVKNNVNFYEKERDRSIQNNRRQLIQLEVQQQLLNNIKAINSKEKQQANKLKQQKQLHQTCFIDIIKRPPTIHPQQKIKKQYPSQQLAKNQVSELKTFTRSNYQQHEPLPIKKPKQIRYKLNIQQILKIPHRLFLVFYSDNYHQIVRLCSVAEMKIIDNYRDQALQRQQALQKLKKKVSEEGPEMINKLPAHSRQKLFKILYEKDVEQEKYYQNKDMKQYR